MIGAMLLGFAAILAVGLAVNAENISNSRTWRTKWPIAAVQGALCAAFLGAGVYLVMGATQ